MLSLGDPDPPRRVWRRGLHRSLHLARSLGLGQLQLGPRPGTPAPRRRRRRRATQLFRGLPLPGGSHGQGRNLGGCERRRGDALVSGAGQVLGTCGWYPLYSGCWRRGREGGHTLCRLGWGALERLEVGVAEFLMSSWTGPRAGPAPGLTDC